MKGIIETIVWAASNAIADNTTCQNFFAKKHASKVFCQIMGYSIMYPDCKRLNYETLYLVENFVVSKESQQALLAKCNLTNRPVFQYIVQLLAVTLQNFSHKLDKESERVSLSLKILHTLLRRDLDKEGHVKIYINFYNH